jgi:hypothetical protein
MSRRAAVLLILALFSAGCMFSANVRVEQRDGAPSFDRDDEAMARAVVVRVARGADFREVDLPDTLADRPSSPYRWIVSLSGEGFEQDTVRVLVGLRNDGREIRVVVSDSTRGTPRSPTQRLIDDLRSALEQAFPDCRVEVAIQRKPRLFGP